MRLLLYPFCPLGFCGKTEPGGSLTLGLVGLIFRFWTRYQPWTDSEHPSQPERIDHFLTEMGTTPDCRPRVQEGLIRS